MMVLVALCIPLTTLHSSSTALGAGAGMQSWIFSAMPLGCAVGLLPSGALGDDYGRRRVFIIGLAVMGLALLGGGLAQGPLQLVLLRVLQGMGGAAVMACGLGLIAHAFPGAAERASATTIWAAALGAGVALGPLLAALIDNLAGWRWVYVAEAALVTLLAASGSWLLPEIRAAKPRPVDLAGTVTLGGGMAALLVVMTETRNGRFDGLILSLVVTAMVLLGAFVAIERRKKQPMLDLGLFARPDFATATLGAFFSGAGIIAIMSVLPTVLERGYGESPVTGALVLLAWSGTSVIVPFVGKLLPDWASPQRLLVFGLVACAVGPAAIAFLGPQLALPEILPGLFLAGVGNGLLNLALGKLAIFSVPAERSAMGSGANNSARYLGTAAGLTLAATILANAGQGDDAVFRGWAWAAIASALLSGVGAVCVYLIGRGKACRVV